MFFTGDAAFLIIDIWIVLAHHYTPNALPTHPVHSWLQLVFVDSPRYQCFFFWCSLIVKCLLIEYIVRVLLIPDVPVALQIVDDRVPTLHES